jgi:hypothetical protein
MDIVDCGDVVDCGVVEEFDIGKGGTVVEVCGVGGGNEKSGIGGGKGISKISTTLEYPPPKNILFIDDVDAS